MAFHAHTLTKPDLGYIRKCATSNEDLPSFISFSSLCPCHEDSRNQGRRTAAMMGRYRV